MFLEYSNWWDEPFYEHLKATRPLYYLLHEDDYFMRIMIYKFNDIMQFATLNSIEFTASGIKAYEITNISQIVRFDFYCFFHIFIGSHKRKSLETN